MERIDSSSHVPRRATVLLAKSSITGAADREMEALVGRLQSAGDVGHATYAFSEQGSPALRDVMMGLAEAGFDEVFILPCLLPMEPGFRVWIDRALFRWRTERPQLSWPSVRIGEPPARLAGIDALLQDMAASVGSDPVSTPASARHTVGSLVPAQRYRVLVCHGGPCNNAGAALVWGRLRSDQKRLKLRTTGEGVMSAKTSCLGPCNLAPVVQVFPDGT